MTMERPLSVLVVFTGGTISSRLSGSAFELSDAPFWSDSQRKFLKDEYRADAGWIEIIDELNTRLHKDAMDAANLTK